MQTSKMLAVAVVAGVFLLAPRVGHTDGPGHIDLVKGACNQDSHTAEGPIDADLTHRRSRFYCDSAVINMFDDYKGHVMVQFAQKESHHSPILAFAGHLDNDGIMMTVDHVYLVPKEQTTVSEGYCKFFFENGHMKGIFCGMKVDETGRRTTAIVGFDAAPGQ